MSKKCKDDTAELVIEAVLHWDPKKPRRWLAKYGNLAYIGCGVNGSRYRVLRDTATALTTRKRLRDEGDYLPEVTFRVGW